METVGLFIFNHFFALLIAYLTVNFFATVGYQVGQRMHSSYRNDRFWIVFWCWPFQLIGNMFNIIESLGDFTAKQIATSAKARRLK